jgi:hypothetical protein
MKVKYKAIPVTERKGPSLYKYTSILFHVVSVLGSDSSIFANIYLGRVLNLNQKFHSG